MNKRSKAKKTTSKKTIKGIEAVKKGAKFQDKVADLYRLLGAEVVQNIEICQKKVDIFATFRLPGSTNEHRVIVECKDEKKPRSQNQRVMELQGLLDIARKAGEAESAEIITGVDWSDQAKGFAKKSGIGLLTYFEKISKLIDFSSYLKDIKNKFEKKDPQRPNEPPLGEYYIDLNVIALKKQEQVSLFGDQYIYDEEENNSESLDEYVRNWINKNKIKKHLAILGGYGTGKTSYCVKLASDLAKEYLEKPGSTRIPILLNLRDFTKNLKIESLITSFLDEQCGVINPKYNLFKAMNESGNYIIIFDGFDEMAVRVDSDILEMNLQEIEKLAINSNSKIIITSRIEYFISGEEQEKAFLPKIDLLPTREIEYQPLKIMHWNDEQIDSFLRKRVPLIKEANESWTYYSKRIQEISGLSDLSKRPVLLEMIVKTLPQLITSGKPIDRPNLYETYLTGEIKRQKIIKKRMLLLSEKKRFSLLQKLAINFYIGDLNTITYVDAQKYIEKFIKPLRSELEAYTRDFLTCSFLLREGDKYIFSHRSIMEYLIAKKLYQEIKTNKPVIFQKKIIPLIITGILVDYKSNKERLWDWIISTRTDKSTKYLAGNSVTLLTRMDHNYFKEKDLSNTYLNGADFTNINLLDTCFKDCILENVSLENAKFLEKNIKEAIIRDTNITLYLFDSLEKRKNISLYFKRRYGFGKVEKYYIEPINKLLNKIFSSKELEKDVDITLSQANIFKNKILGIYTIKTNSFGNLDKINKNIKKLGYYKVAIYNDEREKLIEAFGDRRFVEDMILRSIAVKKK